MRIDVKPSTAKGIIKAPSSKSYAHRILISLYLSGSDYKPTFDISEDIEATLNCLESLKNNESRYFANESGSTLRFLIPLILVLKKEGTIVGTEKLFSRGLDVYLDIFKKQKIEFQLNNNSLFFKGELKNDVFVFPGNISSQYVTGLLFALPLLNGDSEIILTGNVESNSYIDITIDILSMFGISVKRNDNHFYIKGKQKYIKPSNVDIEGDYSNAAFLDAFNLLGGNVKITNLNPNSLQGDRIYQEIYQKLENSSPLIDLSNCIDLGPILFTMSSMKNGATFINFERLKIKESNRLNDMLNLLSKFGVNYNLNDSELIIFKSDIHKVDEIIVAPNDHRIVMSLVVLFSKIGGSLLNGEAVNKSYPNFYKDIMSLGIEVEMHE